jgi:hypothetical protein
LSKNDRQGIRAHPVGGGIGGNLQDHEGWLEKDEGGWMGGMAVVELDDWVLDYGSRLPISICWSLVASRWSLVAGRWSLVAAGRRSPVAGRRSAGMVGVEWVWVADLWSLSRWVSESLCCSDCWLSGL